MNRCIKSKAHRSIEPEKETDDVKLQRQIASWSTDRDFTNKRETVWERLSKLRKGCSTSNDVRVVASSAKRTKSAAQKQCLRAANKLSSPPKRASTQRAERSAFVHGSAVKGFVTARSLREDGPPSSDINTHLGRFVEAHKTFWSEDSSDEYTLAPLLSSQSTVKSVGPLGRTETLQCDKTVMVREGVEVAKCFGNCRGEWGYVKKSAESQENVSKAQLPDIRGNLDGALALQQCRGIEHSTAVNEIESYAAHRQKSRKLEVEVIFRNIPSLHKEIEILKVLGEQLEASLKSTSSYRSTGETMSEMQGSIMSNEAQLLYAQHKSPLPILKVKYEVCESNVKNEAQVLVQATGIRHCMGIVKEFRIAKKSILELKRESSRLFYIRKKYKSLQLKKTTFEALKETPNEFLRHCHPKNSKIAFNVLDQDPVFFHTAINKLPRKPNPSFSSTDCQLKEKCEPSIEQTFCEGANNCLSGKSEPNTMNSFNCRPQTASITDNELAILHSLTRRPQRRHIRNGVTPMPIKNYYCAKNSLLKTILAGFVQLCVFILFIMALTYPDASC